MSDTDNFDLTHISALIEGGNEPSWLNMASLLAAVGRDPLEAERASKWALSVLRSERTLSPRAYAALVSLLRPEAWGALWQAGGLDLRATARKAMTLG